MRRLILLLALLLCAPAAFAQGPPQPPTVTSFPAWITPPTFINGAGVASGPILLPDGTAAAPSLTFASQTNKGIYTVGADTVDIAVGGGRKFAFGTNNLNLLSDTACLIYGQGGDVNLCRDGAANTLALRNAAAAQEFRIGVAAGYLRIIGAADSSAVLRTVANTALIFGHNDGNDWQVNTSGNFADLGSHTMGGNTTTVNALTYQVAGNAFGSSTVGPSSVSGTTSTAALVMAGLGGSFTTRSGRFSICMSGNLDNTTVNDGSKVQISFGTTVPTPTLNAPLQGTQVGPIQQLSQAALPAATITPFGACWVVTGQTKNTTFWTDVAYGALTGGTAVLSQASVIAYDIP